MLDPIIEFISKVVNKLNKYATLILVIITSIYVVITWQSLKVIKEQVAFIKEDYKLRLSPEIQIFTPMQGTSGDIKGTKIEIKNSGFPVTGVKLNVIAFYDEEPDPRKLGFIIEPNKGPTYAEEDIFKIGTDVTYIRFIPEYEYRLNEKLSFLICVTYKQPLTKERGIEYFAFSWIPRTQQWVNRTVEDSTKMLEKALEGGLLEGF